MQRPIFKHRYGITQYHQLDDLQVELIAYKAGLTIEEGGLGLAGHFRNITNMLYGPKSREPWIWSPWSDKMCDVAHEHPITGVARPHVAFSGCASSSKSHFGALFGIINWLCDPWNTYVFMTSTSLSEAKHRVWKSVVKLYMAAKDILPGKLIDSLCKIPTVNDDGNHNDSAGIFLIAAAPTKEREAIGKLIGKKAKRVIFIADELPELSHAIPEAAFGNLMSNELFQFMALGNFKSRYDPFGELVEPKDGWDSINVDSDEWECARFGNFYCVHFDGMKSPNIMAGTDLYPHMYGSKQLNVHRRDFGDNSAMFWRMCRSFEAPIGLENCIYSEAELSAGRAYDKAIWKSPPLAVSSMDPSFTNGGDRTVQMIGHFGISIDDQWVLQLIETLVLHDDAKLIKVSRDYQIARQFRDNCKKWGVEPGNAALDVTGAGSPLYSIICEEWSHYVVPVNFSGAPSQMYVRVGDQLPAHKQFDRRVSELWWVGKEFMRFGQIKGVTKDLARELRARYYETVKGVDGLKVCVEKKEDMRKRIGFSPDAGDCFNVMIELVRQKHNFLAGGTGRGPVGQQKEWAKEVELVDQLYANVKYEEPEYYVETFLP